MGKTPSFSKKSDRDIESGAKSRAIEDWGSAQQVGFATTLIPRQPMFLSQCIWLSKSAADTM